MVLFTNVAISKESLTSTVSGHPPNCEFRQVPVCERQYDFLHALTLRSKLKELNESVNDHIELSQMYPYTSTIFE